MDGLRKSPAFLFHFLVEIDFIDHPASNYEQNIIPTYAWYHGTAEAYMAGDIIDPAKVTSLNRPVGSNNNLFAKIMPFKVHEAVQPYGSKFNYIAFPKVWSPKGDMEAFWRGFDWKKAILSGMKANGLEFSGDCAFTQADTYCPSIIRYLPQIRPCAVKIVMASAGGLTG